jgi:imidazolonepropionase-like amidohydrolase
MSTLRAGRVSFLIALAVAVATPAHAQTVAYTGATVWDGTGAPAMPNATLVVQDGRVRSVGRAAVPAGATVVDLSGRWVVPGLINAHGHVNGRWAPDGTEGPIARIEGDLLLYARYGVTTVNSLGDAPAEAATVRRTQGRAQGRAGLGRARLHFAGPVIGGTSAMDTKAAVDANADAGVDWIKIRVDDNLGTTEKMPWPVVQAVMDEARVRGMRVATHLFYLADAKRLLRMGSGLIAHSVRDADVDAELVALLRDTGVCYVPTLTREVSTFAYAEHPDFFDDPFFLRWADRGEMARLSRPEVMRQMAGSPQAARYRVALRQAQKNVKTLVDAGIPIAMGTDSGPAGRFPGYFEHMELDLMAEAGMTPEQLLRSATGVAADCLGVTDVGTLEPGRWADFLVLDADPLADVSAMHTLSAVYIAGAAVR